MSRSSFGFRRSFNAGRKLSRENRKDINSQQQGQARSEHNDMHEKRQRSRHDNSDADKATRSIFGDVPLTDTERRYLWAAQSGNLPALEMLVEESGTFNLSCRDYLGRTALQLAVLGEHYDCIQLLLEKSRLDVIEEGLLHAIKTENVKICDMFLAHPVYSDQRSRMQLEFQHGFYEQEDSSSSFAPDITPIVLAAQCNNFDIVHMLIQKGFTIQTPHNYFCLCTECYNHKNFDRVVHSKSRLNAYRGLASTAYLALSCDDPIYAAFELSRSLQKLAEREKEHKSEYRGLSDKCKNFAVDLLDQCRTNEEVMSALHGGTNTRDLSRIKMAIRYEQKKFIAHASCQEHLASMWYAGASWFQHQNFPIKLVMVPLGIIFIPVTAIVYVFLPYSRIGKILKSPFMKFMNYICSYTAFLVLLFLGTQLSSFKSVHLFNGIEGVVNSLIMFYVLGMFWAECKQLWEEGVKGYFSQMWNYMDITMLALYTAGYSTEGVIYTKTNGLYMDNHLIHSKDDSILNPQILSKVLFSVANVMSFARIAYILPASETFGQLQISYGRMLQDVGKFIFIYFTVMIAFICGLTSLYSISKNVHFSGLLETTGTLFWAAFGMGVSVAPAIEDQVQEGEASGGKDGEIPDSVKLKVVEVVGYILYGVYILGAVVVLINMLIAMMSNTFEDIQKSEDSEWKFARAKLWISFIEQGTTLPIPFNIIPTPKSILRLFRWFRDCVCCEVDRNEWKKEDVKHYELEYKAIMHRVVLRYIHKMKFEKKGESLKDDILDTREEMIYQLHSMYGRLAARLELLERDVYSISRHAWDGNGSPTHSTLSYSRSVPSHQGNDSVRNSTTDLPREPFLYRRRSYYHERPKREAIEGGGRLSLEERLRKYSGEDGHVRGFRASQGNIHEMDTNMSDGDKRCRKVSSGQTPIRSSTPSMLAGQGCGGNATVHGSGEQTRKESVVSATSQCPSDADEYSLTRRDSHRIRGDGAFSPRPGGERRGRDDNLRGSRKGYNSSPIWNQGVIKESSLEDQINSSEAESSFSVQPETYVGGGKRRETYNHPNIDAPFGLPGDSSAHSNSFKEYHEPRPPRTDTIQNLVLDVHQMPFTKLEAGTNPVKDSLSPTEEDAEKGRHWSCASTPRSADDRAGPKTFTFSVPCSRSNPYGCKHESTKSYNSDSHNSSNSHNNSSNNESDSEDQYAAKISNVALQQKNRMYRYQVNSRLAGKSANDTDIDTRPEQKLDPVVLTNNPNESTFNNGRKVGHVNHIYVPEPQPRDNSVDPKTRDTSNTNSQTNTRSQSDSIFYTKVPLETKSIFSEGSAYPITSFYQNRKDGRLLTAELKDGLNAINDSEYVTNLIRNNLLKHSLIPLAKSEVFNPDNDSNLPASATEKDFVASVHRDAPTVHEEEEDDYIDAYHDMKSYLEPAPEELGMVQHHSEITHHPQPRGGFLKKRESLPAVPVAASKHHRILVSTRDPRSRYLASNPSHQDYHPPTTWYPYYQYPPDQDMTTSYLPPQEYEMTPMVIPSMAANLLPFPIPVQTNDVYVQRPPSTSDQEQGNSSGNESQTPKRKTSSGKKPSLVSLVRGRRSDKIKGNISEIKHNRSLSLNRFSGSRRERLKTLQSQRSKEV